MMITGTPEEPSREGGHAYAQEMDNLTEVDGEPTPASLEAELRKSLQVVLGETE